MVTKRPRGRVALVIVAMVGAIALAAGGLIVARPWQGTPQTSPPIAAHPQWSVARAWDEALLDAIRRALPNPPVHARNLFHTSAAMWDAWAAYDPQASGYLVKEKDTAPDVAAARNEAISYAAYRVLTARYIKAVGADKSLSEFDDLMDSLVLSARRDHDRRRFAGCGGEPDRQGGARLRAERRVEPGRRLRRSVLPAGQSTARGGPGRDAR